MHFATITIISSYSMLYMLAPQFPHQIANHLQDDHIL